MSEDPCTVIPFAICMRVKQIQNQHKPPLHQTAAYCEQIILKTTTSDNVIELTGQLQVQNSVRYAKMIYSGIIPNRR